MVSLNWVTTMGFAILAILCACVFLGMRRMPSLAWLVATTAVATVQTIFLADAHLVVSSSHAVTILTPIAYLCFGQAVRSMLGQRYQNWLIYGAVAGLTVLGIILKIADVPFVVRTPMFQMACALALFDGLERLMQNRSRGIIDYALMLVIAGIIGTYLYRGIGYPLMFPTETPYAQIMQLPHEPATLVLTAICSASSVLLMMARIINGVIVNYRRRSELDSLTGLLNHQAFHQLASVPSKNGGCVIFCDIDHFKSINDRFGHSAGDKALCAFAELLRGSGYQTGRLGGEEFALVLPGAAVAVAMIEAERLRKKFSDVRHSGMPGDVRITASFGVARYPTGTEPQWAFSQADNALYAAKSSGRNRVCVHELLMAAQSAAA